MILGELVDRIKRLGVKLSNSRFGAKFDLDASISSRLYFVCRAGTTLGVGWAGEAQNAFNEGVKHHQAGKFKEAIAAYDRAIKVSPDASEAYNNRGLAYHKLGQIGNALKDYDQAIKLNPNFTDALYNRGNALLAQKQYEGAIKGLRPSHQAESKDAESL